MLSASKAKEEATPLDTKVQTQDGGRCSDTSMVTLSTRKVRSLMFTVDSITKTDKFGPQPRTTVSASNGISCILMSKSQSQRRVR